VASQLGQDDIFVCDSMKNIVPLDSGMIGDRGEEKRVRQLKDLLFLIRR
jgi:hypothetical protein